CSKDGSPLVEMVLEPQVHLASSPWDVRFLPTLTETVLKEQRIVVVAGGHGSLDEKAAAAMSTYALRVAPQIAKDHIAARSVKTKQSTT
ncbi:MAG: hypothetical protein AABY13_00955, partial [Nanoarchaeota archaeon]